MDIFFFIHLVFRRQEFAHILKTTHLQIMQQNDEGKGNSLLCILCSPLNGGEHCIYSNSNACAGKGLHQQNLTRIIWANPLNFSIVITVF